MLRFPLVVLMVGYSLPSWLEDLTRQKTVAVLSPDDGVTSGAEKMEGVVAGQAHEKFRTLPERLGRKRTLRLPRYRQS
jgi:hypothetical protein